MILGNKAPRNVLRKFSSESMKRSLQPSNHHFSVWYLIQRVAFSTFPSFMRSFYKLTLRNLWSNGIWSKIFDIHQLKCWDIIISVWLKYFVNVSGTHYLLLALEIQRFVMPDTTPALWTPLAAGISMWDHGRASRSWNKEPCASIYSDKVNSIM